RSAATVADTAVNDHVLKEMALAAEGAIALPHAPPPSTMPVTVDGKAYLPPRLVGMGAGQSESALTKFERAAVKQFQEHPEEPHFARYYETKDGSQGYRYARPLYGEQASCLKCHRGAGATETSATQ